MSAADDWEEQMIDRLVEMFQNMGMSLGKQQIKALMEQFKSQFDKIGLDAEKMAKGDVNFNFDLSNLAKMFQSGQSMEDILSNLGMDIQVDAAPSRACRRAGWRARLLRIRAQCRDLVRSPCAAGHGQDTRAGRRVHQRHGRLAVFVGRGWPSGRVQSLPRRRPLTHS